MRRLGDVVSTAQGLLVVRCQDDDRPDVGATAVDESLAEVGRVVDVFGPVEQPYLAITPEHGISPAALLGAKLYAR